MNKRGEVSDFAVRDFLQKPAQIELSESSENPEAKKIREFLNGVVKKVNEKNNTKFETILVLTPSKNDRNVINAKPEGRCDECGQEAWVSPSSKARLHDTVKVCTDCLGRVL